jgi:hypothetical protein
MSGGFGDTVFGDQQQLRRPRHLDIARVPIPERPQVRSQQLRGAGGAASTRQPCTGSSTPCLRSSARILKPSYPGAEPVGSLYSDKSNSPPHCGRDAGYLAPPRDTHCPMSRFDPIAPQWKRRSRLASACGCVSVAHGTRTIRLAGGIPRPGPLPPPPGIPADAGPASTGRSRVAAVPAACPPGTRRPSAPIPNPT